MPGAVHQSIHVDSKFANVDADEPASGEPQRNGITPQAQSQHNQDADNLTESSCTISAHEDTESYPRPNHSLSNYIVFNSSLYIVPVCGQLWYTSEEDLCDIKKEIMLDATADYYVSSLLALALEYESEKVLALAKQLLLRWTLSKWYLHLIDVLMAIFDEEEDIVRRVDILQLNLFAIRDVRGWATEDGERVARGDIDLFDKLIELALTTLTRLELMWDQYNSCTIEDYYVEGDMLEWPDRPSLNWKLVVRLV